MVCSKSGENGEEKKPNPSPFQDKGWRGLGWGLPANPSGHPCPSRPVLGTMTQWGNECQRQQPHIWKGFCREGRINPSHSTLLSLSPSR